MGCNACNCLLLLSVTSKLVVEIYGTAVELDGLQPFIVDIPLNVWSRK